MIEREFVPSIRRHAIAGIAIVRTENAIFKSELAIEMVLDVLSERGYLHGNTNTTNGAFENL